jgi:hypothetical protein
VKGCEGVKTDKHETPGGGGEEIKFISQQMIENANWFINETSSLFNMKLSDLSL